MNSRPNSGSKTSTGHRRTESSGNNRYSSSSSGPNRSDSGQSIDSEYHKERKHGHHRSKSGIHEREKVDNTTQLTNRIEFRSTQGLPSDGHHYSRPTSLYPLNTNDSVLPIPDALHPEREPIRFDVALAGAPPEVEQLVNNIKQVAEQFLYHWRTFPIILPNPVSMSDSFPTSQIASDGSLGRCKTKFHLRDLFIAPSFDELDAVAVDSKGEPRKLTGKQLEYIRERGEFEVASLNFPGQQHRWKLSQLLQKGTEKSRDTLLEDLTLALLVLFTSTRRIISPFFSVSNAAQSLLAGLLRILDVFIGIPSLQAHNLDASCNANKIYCYG